MNWEGTGMGAKIVLCSYSKGQGNGIARMDELLLEHLARLGLDVFYIFISSSSSGVVEAKDKNKIEISLDKALVFLKEFLKDVDIVQFNGGYDPVVCSAAALAENPFVLEVMHNYEPGGMHSNILHTICVSRLVQSVQPDTSKSSVIWNGIKTSAAAPSFQSVSPDTVIFLQPSRRTKPMHYNLDDLAPDIVARYPNSLFWLAGQGQTLQESQRDRDVVRYFGLVQDMADLYKQADFMVLLAKQDPFGLVAAEAMSWGCLPIVSKDSGAAEYVVHGKNGYVVDCSSKEQVYEALFSAIENRTSDASMRRSARETAISQLSAEACSKKYEEVYSYLIKNKMSLCCKHAFEHPELYTMESHFLSAALLYRQKQFKESSFQFFSKAARSPAFFAHDRIQHPFWGSAFGIAAEAVAELASKGRSEEASAICEKLFCSKIMFPEYLRVWTQIGIPGEYAQLAEHACRKFGVSTGSKA